MSQNPKPMNVHANLQIAIEALEKIASSGTHDGSQKKASDALSRINGDPRVLELEAELEVWHNQFGEISHAVSMVDGLREKIEEVRNGRDRMVGNLMKETKDLHEKIKIRDASISSARGILERWVNLTDGDRLGVETAEARSHSIAWLVVNYG